MLIGDTDSMFAGQLPRPEVCGHPSSSKRAGVFPTPYVGCEESKSRRFDPRLGELDSSFEPSHSGAGGFEYAIHPRSS